MKKLLILLLIISGITFAETCNSCAECTTMIQNDSISSLLLGQDIANGAGMCMEVIGGNVRNKVFDGQGFTINASTNILFVSGTNNNLTIKNTNFVGSNNNGGVYINLAGTGETLPFYFQNNTLSDMGSTTAIQITHSGDISHTNIINNTFNVSSSYAIQYNFNSANMTNNTIANNSINVSGGGGSGIYMAPYGWNISNTTIYGNNITTISGFNTIYIIDDNTLDNLNISSNRLYGEVNVDSAETVSQNSYLYNNLLNDTVTEFWGHRNVTNTTETNIIGGATLGGNYWFDYGGIDSDGDGIGDLETPHNNDSLPLTNEINMYNPVLSIVTFTPNPPYDDQAVIASVNYTDGDNQVANLTWQWYVAGISVLNETSTSVANGTTATSTLDEAHFVTNSLINVTVTANDSYYTISASNSTTAVINPNQGGGGGGAPLPPPVDDSTTNETNVTTNTTAPIPRDEPVNLDTYTKGGSTAAEFIQNATNNNLKPITVYKCDPFFANFSTTVGGVFDRYSCEYKSILSIYSPRIGGWVNVSMVLILVGILGVGYNLQGGWTPYTYGWASFLIVSSLLGSEFALFSLAYVFANPQILSGGGS